MPSIYFSTDIKPITILAKLWNYHYHSFTDTLYELIDDDHCSITAIQATSDITPQETDNGRQICWSRKPSDRSLCSGREGKEAMNWRAISGLDSTQPYLKQLYQHAVYVCAGEVKCCDALEQRGIAAMVELRAIMRLEGFDQLKKTNNDLNGNRTRDLPGCNIVPQPTSLPRDHVSK
jgi:hypothetical protein